MLARSSGEGPAAATWPHSAPTRPENELTALRQSGRIRVKITGRHRRVLMAGDPLKHGQANVGRCHPLSGRRRRPCRSRRMTAAERR